VGVRAADRVLIVGGGIGGLTLARALHQVGVEVEVLERNPTWEVVGAGLSVQPNGIRALQRVGLASSVVEAGSIIERWLFVDQTGEVLCSIDLGSVWGDVAPFVGIARRRLQEALVEGVSEVRCRLGLSIDAIEVERDEALVRFSDGSTSGYDLVVGADGIGSSVRRLVFGDIHPTFAGQISWRSIAPMQLDGPPSVQFWLGDRCFFGLCSIGDGSTYGFANVSHGRQYDPVEGRLERLRRRFSHFGGLVQEYLANLETDEQIHCSSIEWLEHDRWRAPRVVLIGDAAHATSPMMGQGGCLAMEDACVLAELVANNAGLDSALSEWVQRRAPRVTWVQQQSRAVAEQLNVDPAARNDALRAQGVDIFHARYAPLTADL
jgi:2-polyprenyl-6-methoxyphenol hydroxylase-like FAD-dependent oxidoreductase